MKEIGGYLELDTYSLPMLHGDALALNSGRACLQYLIEQKGISRIALPQFICGVVPETCRRCGVEPLFYETDSRFRPVAGTVPGGAVLYLVNYYGQLTQEEITGYLGAFPSLIVDNAQAYFAPPVSGADTLYTCRKFFGVSDGGLLYTDAPARELAADESHGRMSFVLGRYERPASEFFAEASANNDVFDSEGVRAMSPLTRNLLHAIDYEAVRTSREANWQTLDELLGGRNLLSCKMPAGPFAYPFMTPDAQKKRRALTAEKIYIPQLWPDAAAVLPEGSAELAQAENILPLPVDQRYSAEDMHRLAEAVLSVI